MAPIYLCHQRDYSITPADVPAVLPGSPSLYIEDSITPVDVPVVLGGSPSLL